MQKLKKISPLIWVCLLTLALFAPALKAQFLSWDDDRHILQNPAFLTGDFASLWTQAYYGLYIPVIYSLWDGIYQLVGENSRVYHLLNLVLHVLNVILIFQMIQSEDKNKGKWFAAAGLSLFALHPLQVESVAWISAGRDLLSALFALLAVKFYFSKKSWLHWFFSPLFYLAGLLCKPAIITIPILLWTLQTWKSPKDWLRNFGQILSWILVSLPIFWISQETQLQAGTLPVAWWQKPLVILDSMGFYLQKLIWPFHLTSDYGRTPAWLMENLNQSILPICLFLAFLSLAFWPKTRKNWRTPVVAYIFLLLPVSGLVTFGFQTISTVSDHYMYLPMAALSWGISRQLADSFPEWNFSFKAALTFSLSAVLFFLSSRQIPKWIDDQVFFESMAAENPNSFSAHANLGHVYQRLGNIPKAAEHVFEAYRLAPSIFANIANAFVMLQLLGQNEKVIRMDVEMDKPEYSSARQLQPRQWAALATSVALALEATGHDKEAVRRICDAYQTDPLDPQVQGNFQSLKEKFVRKNIPVHCDEYHF